VESVDDFRAARAQADQRSWPALLAELIIDFTEVVEAEARLASASIEPSLTRAFNRCLLQLILLSFAFIGTLLVIGAGILLLHHWMEWWMTLGIAGVVTVAGTLGQKGLKDRNG
jgi:hypothetical protein